MMIDEIVRATAVILTVYNPDIDELRNNINTYSGQVGLVLVCDNSTDCSIALCVKDLCERIHSLEYKPMGGNKGIAAAQNAGIESGITLGYKFFIEIDQDSRLPPRYVVDIAISYRNLVSKGEQIAGVGPLAVSEIDHVVYHGRGDMSKVTRVDKTLSSGFFFSSESYRLVGPKEEGLFIDYVDWEWCWRASQHSLSTFVDPSLKLSHTLGNGHVKFLFWKVGLPEPIRHYYQYRNGLKMLSRSYVPFGWRFRRFFILLAKAGYYSLVQDRTSIRRGYIKRGILGYIRKERGAFQS